MYPANAGLTDCVTSHLNGKHINGLCVVVDKLVRLSPSAKFYSAIRENIPLTQLFNLLPVMEQLLMSMLGNCQPLRLHIQIRKSVHSMLVVERPNILDPNLAQNVLTFHPLPLTVFRIAFENTLQLIQKFSFGPLPQ